MPLPIAKNKKGFKPYFLFILTGIIFLLYSLVVYYFLDNPNLLRSKKPPYLVFHAHELYVWIGAIWIAIGLFYASLFKSKRAVFLFEKDIYKHFFLTLPLMIFILITPTMDTYYPDATDIKVIQNILIYGGIFSTFAFIAGKVFFLKSLIHVGFSFFVNK